LDALADPDFALKVRERHPEDLDSALRIALQLEVWTKDVDRLRGEKMQEKSKMKRTREVTKTEVAPFARANEALKKEGGSEEKDSSAGGTNGEALHPGTARRRESGRSGQKAEVLRLLGMRRARPLAENLPEEDSRRKETVL